MPGQFVASPIGVLDASGTGVIESQEHTNASHTAITHEFRVQVSKSGSLFTAFSWEDINTEGNVDVSAGGESEFDVSLNQAQFAAALAAAIMDARGGKAAAPFSLSTNTTSVSAAQTFVDPSNLGAGSIRDVRTVMDREVRLEVEAMLDDNGVLEYLEGDSLGDFRLEIDASGAAADMATKLADVTNSKLALRNLFLQIPNRLSELGETDASGARLPVMEGDQLAFIFTSDPKVYITQETKTGNDIGSAVTGSANPLDVSGGAGLDSSNAATLSGVIDPAHVLSTSPRKIAFVIEVVA